MTKRTLGTSGLSVSPITLGGNVFGWTIDEPTSFQILDAWVDRGFNFIDTADVYSRWAPGNQGGESETILGNWLRRSGKRDQVLVATKVGMDLGDGKTGLSKRYIKEAAEASLRRLQTDHIDLYQAHRDDESTPIEETLEAFRELLAEGKVRAIGASNYTGARLTEALELARARNLPAFVSLQPEYNLHERQSYEQDLAPVLSKYQLGSLPYFSLASGFLTGKYKSSEDAKGANREKQVGKYFDERGEKILKALAEVSSETGSPQAAIALAWLLAQPTVTSPIASATSAHQLESLFAAADVQLSAEHLRRLTEAGAY